MAVRVPCPLRKAMIGDHYLLAFIISCVSQAENAG
jgi:hypothetical protein